MRHLTSTRLVLWVETQEGFFCRLVGWTVPTRLATGY